MPRKEIGRGVRICTCISRLSIECSGYLSYTALKFLVDPTGLEPALSRLKVCHSAARVPGQKKEMTVAEGFEPSHGRINSAMPYQLGYATIKNLLLAEGRKAQSLKLSDSFVPRLRVG